MRAVTVSGLVLGVSMMAMFASGAMAETATLSHYENDALGIQFSYPSEWQAEHGETQETIRERQEILNYLMGLDAKELMAEMKAFGARKEFSAAKPQVPGDSLIATSISVVLMALDNPMWETDIDKLADGMAAEGLEIYEQGSVQHRFTKVDANIDSIVYRLSGSINSIPLTQSFIMFRPRKGLTTAIVLTQSGPEDSAAIDAVLRSLKINLNKPATAPSTVLSKPVD